MTHTVLIEGAEPLEASYTEGDPGSAAIAVIAAPHPLYGGSLDNPVVEALAEGCRASGVGSLRFNYRGIGDSAGVASADVSRAVEDYLRAIAWVRARMPSGGKLIAAGYSFGAVTAVEVALATLTEPGQPNALALVAPPIAMLKLDRLRAVTQPVSLLCGDRDSYLSEADARSTAASFPACTLTPCEADHFFGGELDAVRAFAQASVG